MPAESEDTEKVAVFVSDDQAPGARLSVYINDETANILRTVMVQRGITATEAIRRAVGLLNWAEESKGSGCTVRVTDSRGRPEAVLDQFLEHP